MTAEAFSLPVINSFSLLTLSLAAKCASFKKTLIDHLSSVKATR